MIPDLVLPNASFRLNFVDEERFGTLDLGL